jgi:hypothetical protein
MFFNWRTFFAGCFAGVVVMGLFCSWLTTVMVQEQETDTAAEGCYTFEIIKPIFFGDGPGVMLRYDGELYPPPHIGPRCGLENGCVSHHDYYKCLKCHEGWR